MATAGDGATPYQSGGAGGKFRKKPIRRSGLATPYDRPSTALRNKSPSLFAKLVDPASRLIHAGADRFFGVFRKRLPSIAAPRPPETLEEPDPSTNEGGNLASISATTEISELENMLKQKTFTRSEIEHLTALLHAKATNSDDDEGDRAKLPSPSSHFQRPEASTSSPLNKHVEERENIHAITSTPVVTSRTFEEDVASPAELARAYMGTRAPKVSPSTLRFGSQDSALLNTTAILPKTPITSLVPRSTGTFKGLENGFLTTPRSRGRSAIYSMARTPYSRPPSTFGQKGMNSPSLPLSQPAWEQEGSIESSKMASKRRSSVLDDIGSGGPVRRIRQKANLLSQGSPLSKNTSEFRQKLLLRNEADSKSFKAIEENGETSRSSLGYASVPTKSTQMATKILEQLERLSPKEKSPGSRLTRMSEKSPFTPQEKPDSTPKLMSSSEDYKKSESLFPDARESTTTQTQSKGKEKVEENGPKKFAVPRNVLSTMNGSSGVSIRDNGPTDSTFKLPAEPPQKKRFQISAHEDYQELADDDSRSNGGHVSTIPFGQNKKPETSVFGNKDVSAEVIQSPPVEKIPGTQKTDDSKSLPKTSFKSVDGSVVNKKVAFNLPASNNNTQPQPAAITDTVSPQKKATVFPTFGGTAKVTENVSPFLFSANEPSGFKPNATTDAKPLGSTSMFNSVNKESNQVQFPASKKDDNGNALINNKSESSPTLTPSSSSTSGVFSFGAKNTNITNGSISTPSTFAPSSSFPASSTNNIFSVSTTTSLPSTTMSAASGVAPAPPVFSFGSAITSIKSAEPPKETTAEPKSDTTTSPFGTPTTTTTGGGNNMFGFSSPAATNNQGFLFNGGTGGFQTSFGGTTAVQSSTSGGSLFGSSVPSFGLSSAVATSEIKSGSSTTSITPSFGLNSAWQPPKTSPPTTFSFGASSSSSSTSTSPSPFINASTGSSLFSFSATTSAFPAQSTSVFGNSTPVFGSSPNNNDQMSMEDTMAEDSTPSPSPSLPAFGQAGATPTPTPGFMFGSGTPTPSTVPFQFGGQTSQPPQNPFQTNQPPSQNNHFQLSGSADFSGGGSFSLGSGGGDKSGRRILKVRNSKNRKK
ncbi:nuclear pore complex protein NUP1 [Lactuca sativa]|uniref:nuclear pore complex protein NUP1 n=1 Tax=Lactuca sativa TaxID=4236 RepID=UPI000CA6DA1A|nr:nuclear pore complex protein NUP1 [Lactuca sativa]